MKLLVNCLLCSTLIVVVSTDNQLPQVTTIQGRIEGHLKKSFEGRSFAAFEGIPYAKPPVDDLRFAEPQPVEPWIGTWIATHLYTCMQTVYHPDNTIVGDEDCLYLNIYVPEDKLNSKEKLEVIVHIHGGAFMTGSGHEYCHPDYLMDRDVVFVSLNYRLGIFGFLSTGDKELPGNMGLKDQTLALKWIQQNIEQFGGNPNSITLTGLSAGSASVHLHYFSPLSKGLFHRGWAQSGVATSSWTLQEEPLEKTKKLAIMSGCPNTDNKKLVNCLRQRPAKELYSNVNEFRGAFKTPIILFAPVVEEDSPNAFLPDYPNVMLNQKKILDAPLIISTTNAEGLVVTANTVNNLDRLNEIWKERAPQLLIFNHSVPKSQQGDTAIKIKDYFIGENENLTIGNLDKFTHMLSDRWFFSYTEIAARKQAKINQASVYFYHIKYQNNNSFTKLIAPQTEFEGVCHGDDTQYIFANPFPGFSPLSDKDLKMKDLFVDMLVTYAQTNVPNFAGFNWEPTDSEILSYLEIADPFDMKMHTTTEFSALNFWRSLKLLENEDFISAKDEL